MSDERPAPKAGDVRPAPKPGDNSFGGNDPRMIEIENATERAYWMKALDVSEEVLRAAVHVVGPSAQRVKDYLKKLNAP